MNIAYSIAAILAAAGVVDLVWLYGFRHEESSEDFAAIVILFFGIVLICVGALVAGVTAVIGRLL